MERDGRVFILDVMNGSHQPEISILQFNLISITGTIIYHNYDMTL